MVNENHTYFFKFSVITKFNVNCNVIQVVFYPLKFQQSFKSLRLVIKLFSFFIFSKLIESFTEATIVSNLAFSMFL
jgi:hypothetical protein